MDATIIIPQRKNSDLTCRLIDQIRQYEDMVAIRVINDDPDTKINMESAAVDNNHGRGVTSAWNLGVACAETKWVVLLNNDVVCSGPFIKALMVAAGKGVSGPKKRREPLVKPRIIEGWCMAFPKSLWRKLGRFDERLRYYYSDTDFQLRALKLGVKLSVVDVPLRHLSHRTAHDKKIFPKQSEHLRRDRKVFRKKHP